MFFVFLISSVMEKGKPFDTPSKGVMSPTILSAMSWTNAIITHLNYLQYISMCYLDLSIPSGIGMIINITAIRYIWSLILSIHEKRIGNWKPGLGMAWLTHPVRRVVFRLRIT